MKFEPGEKILLWDISGTFLTEPQIVEFASEEDGRIWFTMNDGDYLNGNKRRFRKLTKLDKALK